MQKVHKSPLTPGHKANFMAELAKAGMLTMEVIDPANIIAFGSQHNGAALKAILSEALNAPLKSKGDILRMVNNGIMLPSCSGETIIWSNPLFSLYLDPRFEDDGFFRNHVAVPTPEMRVTMFETQFSPSIPATTMRRMFQSLERDFREMILTQHQIVQILHLHHNTVRSNESDNLFLIEAGSELYVVRIQMKNNEEFRVYLHDLDDDKLHLTSKPLRIFVRSKMGS